MCEVPFPLLFQQFHAVVEKGKPERPILIRADMVIGIEGQVTGSRIQSRGGMTPVLFHVAETPGEVWEKIEGALRAQICPAVLASLEPEMRQASSEIVEQALQGAVRRGLEEVVNGVGGRVDELVKRSIDEILETEAKPQPEPPEKKNGKKH